jgi:hypothetical protein
VLTDDIPPLVADLIVGISCTSCGLGSWRTPKLSGRYLGKPVTSIEKLDRSSWNIFIQLVEITCIFSVCLL